MANDASQPTVALWSVVVLQALQDIENEDYRSVYFSEAVSFLTSGGAWAKSRETIADQIGVHPDDLVRAARRALSARHGRAPLPAAALAALAAPRATHQPAPQAAPRAAPWPATRAGAGAGAGTARPGALAAPPRPVRRLTRAETRRLTPADHRLVNLPSNRWLRGYLSPSTEPHEAAPPTPETGPEPTS